jgi:hypothetical protein
MYITIPLRQEFFYCLVPGSADVKFPNIKKKFFFIFYPISVLYDDKKPSGFFFIRLISLSSLGHTFNFQYTQLNNACGRDWLAEEQGTMAAKWFTVTRHAGPKLSMGTILFQQ